MEKREIEEEGEEVPFHHPPVEVKGRIHGNEVFTFKCRFYPEESLYEMQAYRNNSKKPIGRFTAYARDDELETELETKGCYIDPEFQMRGIGKSLFRLMKRMFIEQGKKFSSIRLGDFMNPLFRKSVEKIKDEEGRSRYHTVDEKMADQFDLIREVADDFENIPPVSIDPLETQIKNYLEKLNKFHEQVEVAFPLGRSSEEIAEDIITKVESGSLKVSDYEKFLPTFTLPENKKKEHGGAQMMLVSLGNGIFTYLLEKSRNPR
jgi:hypothetical protein